MDVFDLAAKITLDSSGYDSGLKSAGEKTKSIGSRIGGGLKTAAKVGTAAIGAITGATTALTGAITKNINETADYGDNVDKMSQKMGISAKAYQEWDAVMQHSGTSIEALKPSMKTLANQAQKNAKEFQALGISQKDVATLNQEELFAKTIEGLQNMEEGTERTAITSKLLGRGATELGALLNTSAKDTQKMKDKVNELGGVMSNKAVKDSAKFKDTLQDLKTSISGLKRGVTGEFMPSVTTVMDGLTSLFSGDEKKGIGKVNKGITSFVNKLNKQMPKIVTFASNLVTTLTNVVVKNLPKFISTTLPTLMKSAATIFKSLAKTLPKLIKTIFSKDNIKVVIDSVKTMIYAVIDSLPDLIPAIIEGAVNLFSGIVEAIPEVTKKVVQKIPELITSIAGALVNGVAEIGKAALSLFFPIIRESEEAHQKAQEAAKASADSIINFVDRIAQAEATLTDTDKLLSSHGRTTQEINTMIEDSENKILEIQKGAAKEKRGLREDELKSIKSYQEKIKKLKMEEMEMYRQQASYEVERIQADAASGKLDEETAAKRIKAIQTYIDSADNALKDWYSSQRAALDNQYKTDEQRQSESYKKQKKALDDWFSEQTAKNEEEIAKGNAAFAESSANMIDQSQNTWKNIAAFMTQFRTDSDNELRNMYISHESSVGALDGVWDTYTKMLREMDNDSTEAFLSARATTVKEGGKLTKENKELANDILSSFEGLPEEFKENGKDTLVKFAKGMEKQNPKLKDAAKMSGDELTAEMRKTLGLPKKEGVKTDSKKFNAIGDSVGTGIINGVLGTIGKMWDAVKKWGSSLIDKFKNFFGIKSPSRVMRDKVGKMLALGIGEGFEDEMPSVIDGMESSLPTSFDYGVSPYASESGGLEANTFNVNINNPNVRSDEDIDKLAQKMNEELGKMFRIRGAAYG